MEVRLSLGARWRDGEQPASKQIKEDVPGLFVDELGK